MTRQRILFCIASSVRGGAEEVILSLLAGLDKDEFALGLACPAPLLEAMGSELEPLEIKTYCVRAESWFEAREVKALAQAIRSFRPDLVNPHLFRTTLVAAPLAKCLGVRRVIETYHGREAWRRGLVKGSFAVDHAVSHWVDRIIAVSAAARDFLASHKKISRDKVIVIPNGRDLSVYQPGAHRKSVRNEFGFSPETPVVGMVGRLEPQKGHKYLLLAFAQVVKEIPNAKLLLVGDGRLKAELERVALELGIRSQVIFTGFRSDVHRVLDAIDLVVLPSLYEGMPLAAIEAAAMAKPIVATDVDGTGEVIKNGVTGRLVPPADAESLRSAMLATLKSLPDAQAMGLLARKDALARFVIEKQIAATAQVYREVLAA